MPSLELSGYIQLPSDNEEFNLNNLEVSSVVDDQNNTSLRLVFQGFRKEDWVGVVLPLEDVQAVMEKLSEML